MSQVDRKKHDSDVMEHVLGGFRIDGGGIAPPTHMVSLDVHPWLGGVSTSAVQVRVNTMPEQPQPSDRTPPPDRHHDYESDRRGEHKYPREDDRPSQRERDELKERLERSR